MDGCNARIWDNGDMIHCGQTVLRAGLCARCLHAEVHSLRIAIQKQEGSLAEMRKRLTELQTERG